MPRHGWWRWSYPVVYAGPVGAVLQPDRSTVFPPGSLTLCIALLYLLAASPRVRADGVQVDTFVDSCVPVDEARFHRILAIELGTSLDGAGETAQTRVRVTCVPEGIELSLEDGITRKSMRRVLRSDALAQGSTTRLLALAVAEFIVASWIELSVTPQPVVEPVGPAPSPDVVVDLADLTRQRRVGRQSSWRVSVGAGLATWATTLDTWMPLALLRASYRSPDLPSIAWRIGGEFAYGIEEIDIGQVEIGQASVSLAIVYLHAFDDFQFDLGVGGRMGAVRLVGQPQGQQAVVGASTLAPHGGMLLNMALHYAPDPGFRIGLEGELGVMTWPVQAYASADDPVVELSGPWLSVALIVGLGF